MSRTLGTVVRGVRAPIFREGDSVVDITVSTVLNALAENNITARDGDVVAVTESVVARCQGNYATVEQISADVRAKTGGETVAVVTGRNGDRSVKAPELPQLAGYTAGRDFHPALKIFIIQSYYISTLHFFQYILLIFLCYFC